MLTAFFLTFVIAALITPAVIKLYVRRNWVDDPQAHRHAKVTHRSAIPRGGGVVVFSAIILASLFLLEVSPTVISLMGGGLLLAIMGVLDDIYDIHPAVRLIAGLIAAIMVVNAGVNIPYITNPFGEGVILLNGAVPALLAIFFILWNMNIVNWSKGVDGQMPGFVAIAAGFVGMLALRFSGDPQQLEIAQIAFIVSGAYAGFLLWNFYPQRIMPGYGAGSLAGYFLAVLAMLSGAKFATTVMVLAIPTADAVFTITRRLLAGKSPLWGDRGHLHHKLLDRFGWGRRRIAVFYWLTSFTLGVLSLILDTQGKILAIIVTSCAVFSLLIWAKVRYQHNKEYRD